MDIGTLCASGFFLSVVALAVGLPWLARARLRRGWQAFAEQHSLGFATVGWPANPQLVGVYRNRQVVVRLEDTFAPRRHLRSTVTASLATNTGLALSLAKKSIPQQLSGSMRRPPAPIGDAYLDYLYNTQSQPQERGAALLRSPQLRPLLETARPVHLVLSGQSLEYHEPELVSDVQALLDYVCDVAEAIEAFAPQPQPVPAAG